MAAGDVTVTAQYTLDEATAIDAALTALYAGVNDKWIPVVIGGRFIIIHVAGS